MHMPPSAACALAVVTYSAHFRVLLQFFLSFAANVIDPSACGLLVLVSTPDETVRLRSYLSNASDTTGGRLAVVMQQLTIEDLPSAVARLSPKSATPLPTAKNKGPLGRLYVCAKKAYAARYAHEVLGAEHAIVTDSEAYVWKRISVRELFRTAASNPAVWFADAPAMHAPKHRGPAGADERAPIDPKWCSAHVFGDARGLTRAQLAERVPSLTATLFESMLFSYPRAHFREYWRAVEAAWGAPWFDAVVAAHRAEPRCVAVGFWLEVSWHLFLYSAHRREYAFRNATAAIAASFGAGFPRRSLYVHARLELLWRSVDRATLDGFRDFYAKQPIPFFRFDHRLRGNCVPLALIADIPPPAASVQANSAVPSWVFNSGACRAELARLKRLNGGVSLPWVEHSTKT